MIGAFWNIRGLNKTGRYECLKDFINNNALEFVGIQETKKIPFINLILMALEKTLAGTSCLLGALLVVSWWASTTSSIIFCLGILEVYVCLHSTHIRNNCDSFSWRLITVYGAAYDEQLTS